MQKYVGLVDILDDKKAVEDHFDRMAELEERLAAGKKEALIASINQGRIFRFLRKPWEPDEIEGAVREAVAEYERLVEHEEQTDRLRAEIGELRHRVAVLEDEVGRLGTHA